jgi:hypothetical protein
MLRLPSPPMGRHPLQTPQSSGRRHEAEIGSNVGSNSEFMNSGAILVGQELADLRGRTETSYCQVSTLQFDKCLRQV